MKFDGFETNPFKTGQPFPAELLKKRLGADGKNVSDCLGEVLFYSSSHLFQLLLPNLRSHKETGKEGKSPKALLR